MPETWEALYLLRAQDDDFAATVEEMRRWIRSRSHDHLGYELATLSRIAAAVASRNHREAQSHIVEARNSSLSPALIREAIILPFLFCGISTVLEGLETLAKIIEESSDDTGELSDNTQEVHESLRTELSDEYDDVGISVGTDLYGERRAKSNFDNFRGWDGDLAIVVEQLVYRRIHHRRVISRLDRELCNLAVLTTLGERTSFEWHAKAALRLGASEAQLRWSAIAQVVYAGFPRVVQSMRSLDSILSDWRAHPGAD